MTHSLLLEIGLEDMPAKVIVPAAEQLKDKVSVHFKDHDMSFDSIQVFNTPRRLAVKIEGLAEGQKDKTESVKGPAKRIALDDEGNWTKAAIGFTRGQQASIDDITFQTIKGEEYVFVEKHIKGLSAEEVIQKLEGVLPSLSFPVSMKWGTHSYRYIRPVHWLTVLLDEKVVDMTLFDVPSGRETRGHRFLGQAVTLNHANDYQDSLKEEHVLVDRNERQELIISQIQALCTLNNWKDPLDNKELLEEVTDLVEYPTAFYGSFSDEYLAVPENVLETAMADHQRYFPVRLDDGQAKFLPYFIAVRNGNAEYIEQVRKGNEKVLSARLADAAFFYDEDRKLSIDDFVNKLSTVSFHEKLGSLYDKQERLTAIAHLLAPYFDMTDEQIGLIERTGMIAKFDLVTQTVNEFTSLQGDIAGIFAAERGEDRQIAAALSEQYLPKSTDGRMPETKLGALLSAADKLDSLLSFFSVDMIPSGSNDPFALRRQAMGIVRIFKAFNVSVQLDKLINAIAETVISVETKAAYMQNTPVVIDFIKDRVDQLLSGEEGLSEDYDVRQAVLESNQTDILALIDHAGVLAYQKKQPGFKAVVESLTRVSNLAEKADDECSISTDLFETQSEKNLYEALLKAEELMSEDLNADQQWQVFAELHPVIDDFFDHTMVMAEDTSVRNNRLALLKSIDDLSSGFARFDRLVIK
ncbi:glycine--tRNA ligase subunit beta [Alkalibacterium indicireducens]|uniref:Glycine--tRNA ligase beta subunit n=1 Tax=Alkalibacterium indicireducens TaxID=398758 RepID=A0ABP3KL62_9LACT